MKSSPHPGTERAPALPADVRARLDRIWKRAYGARTRADLRALYADWARSYDEDHDAIGFAAHLAAAALLDRYVPNPQVRPVLDAGAGTGAAGVALRELGFQNLTAIDLSQEMLDVAATKGVYAQLLQADLGEPLDVFPRSHFHAAILVGVFSYGQAPAHALDELLRIIEPGGVVVFTVRTDFWAEDAMGVRSRAEFLERDGRWRRLDATEPAPYLPKKDPDAMFRAFAYRVVEADDPIAKDAFRAAVRAAAEDHGGVLRLDHAFIWNATASRLYNRYTHRPEYYLTDCEEEILRDNAAAIVGGETRIVELGCGSARKVTHLLEAATDGGRRVLYVPIDVSDGALQATREEVEARFRRAVVVRPEHGMFDDVLERLSHDAPQLVLFFGSSLGNLETIDATVAFLRRVRDRLSPADRFVVGVDLHKDEQELLAAYNAGPENLSFFLNMVRRINDDLGGTFDLGLFELGSTYREEPPSAIEGLRSWSVDLRVVTTTAQRVYVRELDLELELPAGGAVQVGTSRKFRPQDVRRLAEVAGMRVRRQWLDGRGFFSLNELVRDDAPQAGAARAGAR
ncbi:MAG: L-histidine N(alpha)-methyltransferase [Planctomycetes bacterium]|nr:L-histidine N(alpha)-methyltransferase [Planctomycetota bacterium]